MCHSDTKLFTRFEFDSHSHFLILYEILSPINLGNKPAAGLTVLFNSVSLGGIYGSTTKSTVTKWKGMNQWNKSSHFDVPIKAEKRDKSFSAFPIRDDFRAIYELLFDIKLRKSTAGDKSWSSRGNSSLSFRLAVDFYFFWIIGNYYLWIKWQYVGL